MKLEEYLETEVYGEKETFKVTDDSSADWALERIKEKRKEILEKTELAENKIYHIEDWLKAEEEKLQSDIDYFQSLLGEYAMSKRETDPKFKSMKLPNGAIRFRKQQPKWNYDDDLLLKYLKESEETDLINVKEVPNKAAIKKMFPVQDGKLINVGTGEVVEGVTVEERQDKFEVIIGD